MHFAANSLQKLVLCEFGALSRDDFLDFLRTAPNEVPTLDGFRGPPSPSESGKKPLKGHFDDQLLLLFATDLIDSAKT